MLRAGFFVENLNAKSARILSVFEIAALKVKAIHEITPIETGLVRAVSCDLVDRFRPSKKSETN